MSQSITVTLPDGSQQAVAASTRPIDVAKSFSDRLAIDAVVERRPARTRHDAGGFGSHGGWSYPQFLQYRTTLL